MSALDETWEPLVCGGACGMLSRVLCQTASAEDGVVLVVQADADGECLETARLHLAASAPGLYRALTAVLGMGDGPTAEERERVRGMARAALKKARGE